MIVTDEEALICDFAETYRIYDYKKLPLRKAAIFASGLRDNSRIKMKMSGANVPLETLIQASISDRVGLMAWMQSEDGRKNRNRPKSILDLISRNQTKKNEVETFETGENFDREWRRLRGKR